MKKCPYCLIDPAWHFCRNVSEKRGSQHFLFTPSCRHAEQFQKQIGFVEKAGVKKVESEWDALAEKLFEEYTVNYTPMQKFTFKARIWPAPELIIPKRALTPAEVDPLF